MRLIDYLEKAKLEMSEIFTLLSDVGDKLKVTSDNEVKFKNSLCTKICKTKRIQFENL